ncbi:hypothetical protein PoB_003386900 [Plakobranchus ocellatus]|uniref:Uncharacterized protein n=1 Tax=Plakobranchus ocellatus TaxID=259542 RepID=A0AAV4AMF2_9GAST|nr:hypothetical protein PoB_003386900 [Plakobranchus ocellatus]
MWITDPDLGAHSGFEASLAAFALQIRQICVQLQLNWQAIKSSLIYIRGLTQTFSSSPTSLPLLRAGWFVWILPVLKWVISDFQAPFRRTRRRWRGSNPPQKDPCRSQGVLARLFFLVASASRSMLQRRCH